jgi:NitT/TauT family transport system permease protein
MDEQVLVKRPEIYREIEMDSFGVVEKPLSVWERISGIGALRKAFILALLVIVWQIYASTLDNALLFPTFGATFSAFLSGIASGVIPAAVWTSIKVLLLGYVIGMALASLLTAFAVSTRIGNDFLETLTAMFNPLPAIALLPIALIWLGLGSGSLVFVLVHSVLWPVALNTHSGFMSVSNTVRMVGRNYGLKGLKYVAAILMPAAFPSILTGMKIGWAFAWRTLIASELVFGVTSGSGGLGWFIYQSKNELEIANVFAGLFTVILIGLFVENVLFRKLEALTVRRWGMQG